MAHGEGVQGVCVHESVCFCSALSGKNVFFVALNKKHSSHTQADANPQGAKATVCVCVCVCVRA